jgi:hypothetical protein
MVARPDVFLGALAAACPLLRRERVRAIAALFRAEAQAERGIVYGRRALPGRNAASGHCASAWCIQRKAPVESLTANMPTARNDLQHVLAAARQLPARARAEIVQTLLREAGARSAGSTKTVEPLWGLTEAELRSLATAVLAPARERRLKTLLRRNREGTLGDKNRNELDALIEEADRVALLKAKAAFTLAQLGRAGRAAA